jgi:hypothetical protein
MLTQNRSSNDAVGELRSIADEIRTASGTRFSKYSPEEPSEKQRTFIFSEQHEGLFGGGVGGGKTSGLLMSYLRDVHVPNYRGLILRLTMGSSKLSGGPLQRSKEWWYNMPDMAWNEDSKTWTFPSGATLTFGYLEHEDDIYRYQGSQWHFLGFDELTHFKESSYEVMALERMRRSMADVQRGIKLRVRSTANPEGPGYEWVTKRFVNPGSPSRLYIASTLHDNPGLDIESYLAQLEGLSPERKRRMVDGIWDPEPPAAALWKLEHIEPFRVSNMQLASRDGFRYLFTTIGVDPAVTSRDSSDETGIVVVSLGNDGHLYVRADITGKYSPNETVELMKRIWRRLERGSGQLRIRYESNQGGDYVGEALRASFDPDDNLGLVKGIPSRVSKAERAWPISQQSEAGHIHHVTVENMTGNISTKHLDDLEREMMFWNPVLNKRQSPNRLDALVVACADLMPLMGRKSEGKIESRLAIPGWIKYNKRR